MLNYRVLSSGTYRAKDCCSSDPSSSRAQLRHSLRTSQIHSCCRRGTQRLHPVPALGGRYGVTSLRKSALCASTKEYRSAARDVWISGDAGGGGRGRMGGVPGAGRVLRGGHWQSTRNLGHGPRHAQRSASWPVLLHRGVIHQGME